MTIKDITLNTRMPEATQALVRNLSDGIFTVHDEEEGRLLTPMEALEREDPDENYVGDPALEGTNVLQRALATMNIRTQDDVASGRPASTVGDMFRAAGGNGRVLFPLWMESRMRQHQHSRFYQSSQVGLGNSALRPHTLATTIQVEPLQRSILNLLVGTMQVGDGRPYTAFFLTTDANKSRLRRITEGVPPAVYSLGGTERTHRVEEFAIELQISYKAAQEYALPALDAHLQRVGERNDRDKEQVAYETHMDGDGNSGSATNTNVSALTGGVASTVTMPNLLEFLRLYESDGEWTPTVAIGPSATVHVLDKSNFGSANYPTFGPLGIAMLAGQGAQPERRLVPPIHSRSYATANKVLFCDASTLRMVYTPMLVERDRVISERFEKIVISEHTGFDHLYDGGRRTLDVNN